MFFPLAVLDYTDKVLVTVAMGTVSASLVGMVKGMVPPIAGVFSYLLFGSAFSNMKISAMALTIFGVMLGCIV